MHRTARMNRIFGGGGVAAAVSVMPAGTARGSAATELSHCTRPLNATGTAVQLSAATAQCSLSCRLSSSELQAAAILPANASDRGHGV